jgi:hypothetical protein
MAARVSRRNESPYKIVSAKAISLLASNPKNKRRQGIIEAPLALRQACPVMWGGAHTFSTAQDGMIRNSL